MNPRGRSSPVAVIAEDDRDLAAMMAEAMRDIGYRAIVAHNGASALASARAAPPSLVLLDLGLPDILGMSLCEALLSQAAPYNPPPAIIVVTGDLDPRTAVRALNLGARDYIRKPFDLGELKARVEAVRGVAAAADTVSAGRLEIGLRSHTVMVDGREVDLTPTEFRILVRLARHAGWVFSREQLAGELGGEEADSSVVASHISNLRRKLEWHPELPPLILTVHGVGYKLAPTHGDGTAT